MKEDEDNPWLESGYPTDEAVQRIRGAQTPRAALDAAKDAWSAYGSVSLELGPVERQFLMRHEDEEGQQFIRFATGGWSGNEYVIEELHRSVIGAMTWELSAVGGLHIYGYPKED